jgi:hypothetical protein
VRILITRPVNTIGNARKKTVQIAPKRHGTSDLATDVELTTPTEIICCF